MPIKKFTSNCNEIKLGEKLLSAIYVGSNLVYKPIIPNMFVFTITDPNTVIILQNDLRGDRGSVITDWGDGTKDRELTHTYAAKGEYIVTTKNSLTTVEGVQDSNTVALLTNILNINPKITNASYMFYNCINLERVQLIEWDSSKINDMSYMFCNCKNLTSVDYYNWNINSGTKITHIFEGCIKLQNV